MEDYLDDLYKGKAVINKCLQADYVHWKESFLEKKRENEAMMGKITDILKAKEKAIEELFSPVSRGSKKVKKLVEFGKDDFTGGTYFQWPSNEELENPSTLSSIKKISVNHGSILH